MTSIKKIFGLLLAAAALLAGAQASAGVVQITGGSTITTAASGTNKNDVLGGGVKMQDNAAISVTGPAILAFYFLGSESGYTNTLRVGGSLSHAEPANGLQTYPSAWPGTKLFSYTMNAGGSVPMRFTSSGFGTTLLPGGGDAAKSIAFAYLSCLTGPGCWTTTPTNTVLFALDDSGAGPDDNHDDYVGYFVATPVPLPPAVWLLGSALLGLLGIGRRHAA